MDIEKFVENFNGSEEKVSTKDDNFDRWLKIIQLKTANIILGYRGTGKSNLAYYLTEKLSQHYDLSPVVVNFPKEKQTLLPENFRISDLDRLADIENAIVIIDEGSTMIPAGRAKLEEMIKGLVALSRQRNQIIFFIFHASADVGARIMRTVDTTLIKWVSDNQLRYGSKDEYALQLLTEAKDKFEALADIGEDIRQYTYVQFEQPPIPDKDGHIQPKEERKFRTLLKSEPASFWCEELSCAWAGAGIAEPQQPKGSDQLTISSLLQKPFLTPDQDPYFYTVAELRELCRKEGIPASGDKHTLVKRLFGFW